MKNMKKLLSLAVVGVALIASQAFGQGRGLDTYGEATTVQLLTPTLFGGSTAIFTNNAIDEHMFVGIAKIDITSFTNAGGALTVQAFTSPDMTNWTALANYSVGTNILVRYTNTMYGSTNLFETNNYTFAAVPTTPVAASAGFASTYLVPCPFTNSGALTITAKGTYTIGYDIDDAGRYLELVFTPTGTSSNDVVSATLTTHAATQRTVIP